MFSHGWPLTADVWDGHASSSPTTASAPSLTTVAAGGGRASHGTGNDLDHYADDLAAVIESLDLHDVVLVGHSTGGGEVTRYIGRHGTSRVAKVVLLGAIPPLMLKTDANPEGLPIEPFDEIRAGVLGRPLAVLPRPGLSVLRREPRRARPSRRARGTRSG